MDNRNASFFNRIMASPRMIKNITCLVPLTDFLNHGESNPVKYKAQVKFFLSYLTFAPAATIYCNYNYIQSTLTAY